MANPTTYFGWVMPNSADLVTDLPADFNVFGQGVDTSMQDLLGGTTGQVLSKTSGTNMDFTWVTPTDQTPLTTKGDLFTFTTVDARLAVGNNGETLVADSSTATGLRYTENYAAGKNAIINGAFDVWQRGTSFTLTTNVTTYTADRFMVLSTHPSGSTTVTQQTFTPGTAPVAGYEGQYFHRITNSAAATNTEFQQRIEDVRTFAGETVTISFWAKASSSVTMANAIIQNFGSGGSANVTTTGTSQTFTTSWARYSITINVPSISGKTVGTSSYLQVYPFYYSSGTIASNVIDVWGVQVEDGSVATAFQTATGTLQGELAACQRYFYRFANGNNAPLAIANFTSASTAWGVVPFPVTMRIAPTLVAATGTNYYLSYFGSVVNFNTLTNGNGYITTTAGQIGVSTLSGNTAGYATSLITSNASVTVDWNSEL